MANVLMVVQGSSAFVLANFNFFVVSASVIGLSYAGLLEWMDRRAFTMQSALAKEKEITDAMLRNFLPDRIVDRLKNGEKNIAEAVGEATVLFADLIDPASVDLHTDPKGYFYLLSLRK